MTATVRGISIDDRSGTITSSGHRTFSITYKVYTDDKRDGPAIVRVAPGIPSIGDTYTAGNEFDSAAVCVDKNVEPTESPFEWLVHCEFTTDPGLYEPKQYDNPLLQPAELTFGFQERRVMIPGYFNNPGSPPSSKDWEQGIFLPNGERCDPQPEDDLYEPIWYVKKNVAASALVYADLLSLANCTNADFWNGAEPRQLRFKPPQAVRKWHKNVQFYWEVSYALVYRWETWDIQIPNQGTYYWAGGKPTNVWSTTQQRKVIRDANGCPIMVNLSSCGDINTTANPTFTRIRRLREISFSALNIL